jgi:multicomponent Na+:H+ antiporter subunit G
MSGEQFADLLAAAFLLTGSALTLAAGIGVLRFPNLLARMHAGAKPQVLGVLLALAGLALRVRSASVSATLALIAIFQLLTAPVSAHIVARAGYRTGKIQPDMLVHDELTADLEAATAEGDQSP